jgi:uncharacterized phosphosugar-binding protein
VVAGSAGRAYLSEVVRLLEAVLTDQQPAVRVAAQRVADAVSAGGLVHVFGTGHSHLLAVELFSRAGGLAQVNPILLESPMLSAGAEGSSRLQKLAGLASALLDGEPIEARDVLILVSNSGSNAACIELAIAARQRGIATIAVTSVTHASARGASADVGPRLHEVVDVVLDNRGRPGDACVAIEGLEQRVAPTSTVVGAALLNAVVAEAVEIMVADGQAPDLFASSNLPGGDRVNAELVARYSSRVRAL